MAALTGNYENNKKDAKLVAYNVGAAKNIRKGGLVNIDDTTGLTEPATDASGKTFCGVAYEAADNSAGSAGAVGGRVEKTGSYVFAFSGGTATQATVGKKVYVVDDHTVALAATTTNDVYAGDVCALVAGNLVRVRIDRAAG